MMNLIAPMPDGDRRPRHEELQSVDSAGSGATGSGKPSGPGAEFTMVEITLYTELEQLADFIRNSRNEIAAIRPQDISEIHIASANDELDAVIRAAEEATGTILDAAEAIDGICRHLEPVHRDPIQTWVTNIYQACNFQDITGQRITKVVKALQTIEERVAVLLGAFGGDMASKPAPTPVAAGNGDADLLNGPQLPNAAKGQDEIDALFASFG
jgi:chemotaxis protein CheZ